MCPPPEGATPPLALGSRADGGRNGPCRVHAPQRTAPEDGKGRGRGTSCTTRPRSGCASPPRGPAGTSAGGQGKVELHVVEDLGELAPLVQILDLPVPQMVDNVLDALRIPERPMAVQVIEVPKILIDVIPSRSLVLEPQSAEQLVEVPTVLSPTRIALQIAEQIVDTPVPQGRGGKRCSTATSSYLERISERTVEQIVDVPSSGGGLGQGSSSSAGPVGKKCGGRRPGECESASALELMDAGGL